MLGNEWASTWTYVRPRIVSHKPTGKLEEAEYQKERKSHGRKPVNQVDQGFNALAGYSSLQGSSISCLDPIISAGTRLCK